MIVKKKKLLETSRKCIFVYGGFISIFASHWKVTEKIIVKIQYHLLYQTKTKDWIYKMDEIIGESCNHVTELLKRHLHWLSLLTMNAV